MAQLDSYCSIIYGAFQMKVCYDLKAAQDLFILAAKDKSRPTNCLALYYLGRIAMVSHQRATLLPSTYIKTARPLSFTNCIYKVDV